MSKGTDFILKVSGNTLSQVLLPDGDCSSLLKHVTGPKRHRFQRGDKAERFNKFLEQIYSEWNENAKAKDGLEFGLKVSLHLK